MNVWLSWKLSVRDSAFWKSVVVAFYRKACKAEETMSSLSITDFVLEETRNRSNISNGWVSGGHYSPFFSAPSNFNKF